MEKIRKFFSDTSLLWQFLLIVAGVATVTWNVKAMLDRVPARVSQVEQRVEHINWRDSLAIQRLQWQQDTTSASIRARMVEHDGKLSQAIRQINRVYCMELWPHSGIQQGRCATEEDAKHEYDVGR